MKHRVLDRTHVFLASEKVQLDFDAKDEPGNYTVNALVKDNIGQKQIPLTASIELIKPEKEHAP